MSTIPISQRVDALVEYDADVLKVEVGQPFNCPEARNHWFRFGAAPYGGRHEFGGPISAEPFAFVHACAGVIDNGPENPMGEHLDLTLHPGDTVFVKHYGFHVIEPEGDGYNLRLTRCAPPA